MDPLQQKALDALEPFILLSKSATSHRAAADLIQQAISAPNTCFFTELLLTPNIQALREAAPEYAPHLKLLEIFSWGTWTDYTSTPDLPPLSESQAHKLRKLSLITLAASPKNLTYPSLLATFSITTTRALEDLVISAIDDELISAKLNPLAGRVDVYSVAPLRDLAPDGLPQIIERLVEWEERCAMVVADLEAQISAIRAGAAERKRKQTEHETRMTRLMWKEDEIERSERGTPAMVTGKRGAVDLPERGDLSGWGTSGDVMNMDVDQEYSTGFGGGRNAKRGNKLGRRTGV